MLRNNYGFEEVFPALTKYFNPRFKSRRGNTYPSGLKDEMKRKFYDYKKLHADLLVENFFGYFADYCRKAGVKCRVQPYNAPADLLRAYGAVDILEIEGFKEGGITGYRTDPRQASSAAHIYNKILVSCESMTWLAEHFTVSLEMMKKEADKIILHGVNRIIYHGFSYSPIEAGNPGWSFFASTFVNPANTWWPYFGELNRYIAKNAFLAHQGKNVADFLIYYPIHDNFSTKEQHIQKLRRDLRNHGHLSDYDYINDECLQKYTFIEKRLNKGNKIQYKVHNLTYKLLLVINTEYVLLKTAEKMLDFAQQGGQIVFIGIVPNKAPGWKALSNGEDRKVKKIFSNLFNNPQFSVNIHHLSSLKKLSSLISSLNIYPDFSYDPVPGLHYPLYCLHRQVEDADCYYLVNFAAKNYPAHLYFDAIGAVELWNTFHDKKEFPQRVIHDQDRTALDLNVKANSSCWIIFRRDMQNDLLAIKTTEYKVIALDNKWNIRFSSPANIFPKEDAIELHLNDAELFDWTQNIKVKYFSGTAEYTNSFEISQKDKEIAFKMVLDLGKVHDVAEVLLNGVKIGIMWTKDYKFDLSSTVKSGINQLTIRVTNRLFNRVVGYISKGLQWRPEYEFNSLIKDKSFDEIAPNRPLLNSGLLGPVQIRFVKQTSL